MTLDPSLTPCLSLILYRKAKYKLNKWNWTKQDWRLEKAAQIKNGSHAVPTISCRHCCTFDFSTRFYRPYTLYRPAERRVSKEGASVRGSAEAKWIPTGEVIFSLYYASSCCSSQIGSPLFERTLRELQFQISCEQAAASEEENRGQLSWKRFYIKPVGIKALHLGVVRRAPLVWNTLWEVLEQLWVL